MNIYDRVHQQIEIPVQAKPFVDSFFFQRLRRVKQLGAAQFVFVSATHSRFEHSLGVAHLARRVGIRLQQLQPELQITNQDLLLLFVAGLLHDVGHGPFSHAYDSIGKQTHEERSIQCTRQLMEQQQFSSLEIQTVCSMIMGDQPGWKFEIVNNTINGFDVDKFDYVLRDATSIGWGSSVDLDRLIQHTRVIQNHLCFHHKVYDDLYEIIRMRYLLHKKVYNHKAVLGIEALIVDLLQDIDASPFDDDGILSRQRDHPLLQRLDRRQHYKALEYHIGADKVRFECRSHTKILHRVIGHGSMVFHPFEKVLFYNKKNEIQPARLETPNVSPCFQEYVSILLDTSS